ncbi:sigma-70 family RNA polymerase sigma factor [Streptomyces sp. DSM 44917]|uniref:Sigma-70 family RNA polymerase sigma factor n=1 Tax=Streptomyces boetiae TaxID=3075541 RepID=A0ABU2LAZ9_9ACTN|nr:sigma-70 family RNA polymerase sigma factor [Streptomyces sp. DSM 44917]MDT0308750.1 sigma-70 family RNA polymerase sigma factor [Streptomyces sp. DSM 44917]
MSHAKPAPPAARPSLTALAAPAVATGAAPVPRPSAGAHPRTPAAERYRDGLLRYVSRLTAGDAHRAEDIVQETMLRAWLAADEFSDGEGAFHGSEDHLAAWLHTVARNLAIDARRRDRALPVGILPASLLHRAADGGAEMAATVAERVTLVPSLARLSPRHREVVVHVYLYDRSRADVARRLGVPGGTVKSRLHYALSALRRDLPAA